jgi:hypothetical protein
VKRLTDQTLYEILEVATDATPEEIRRAHERASTLFGPGSIVTYTLMPPDEAALLVNRIDEARTVLLDPGARSRYDERIGAWPRFAPPAAPERPSEPAAATPPPAAPPAAPPVDGEGEAGGPGAVSEGPPAAVAAEVEATATPSPAAEAPPPTETPPPPRLPATPIPLRQELAVPRDVLVPDGAAWTGEMLRRVRESRGLTLAQVSERTKVTRHHLENIEDDKFAALPAQVYLRGILLSVARELRLDGQRVARSYMERMTPPR